MLKFDYGSVGSHDGSRYEEIILKPGLEPSGKVSSIFFSYAKFATYIMRNKLT